MLEAHGVGPVTFVCATWAPSCFNDPADVRPGVVLPAVGPCWLSLVFHQPHVNQTFALQKVELLCFLQLESAESGHSQLIWLSACEPLFWFVRFSSLDTMLSKLTWLLIFSSVTSGHKTPEDSAQCGNETGSLLQIGQSNSFLSLAELGTQAQSICGGFIYPGPDSSCGATGAGSGECLCSTTSVVTGATILPAPAVSLYMQI
eukprot:s2479_g2.t1